MNPDWDMILTIGAIVRVWKFAERVFALEKKEVRAIDLRMI